jgi:DNA anti-recombination protein RmuC
MSNIDDKIDKLESAVDPNTVISVGGINFTPAKLMIAGGIISSVLGGLYGTFEVYKDYMDMKEAIQSYVTPDLTELYKKIAVLEQNTNKTSEYVRDINVNLKQDIRRVEGVLETVERSVRQSQRDVEVEVREVKRTVDQTVKNVDSTVRSVTQEMNKLERETANELRNIRKEVDDKIKKAVDNPLSNN